MGYFPPRRCPIAIGGKPCGRTPWGVLRGLGVEPGMTAVDLCCGDGYFTAPLAAIVDGRVYGVDLDPALLDLARGEVEHRGGRVRQWICGDARDLPELLAQQVDFVLLANTFHGVPEKTLLACNVATVLRPGGRFAIVNWRPLAREQTVFFGSAPWAPNRHAHGARAGQVGREAGGV